MTASELLSQLVKLSPDTEIWVDTPEGLFPVDMTYEDGGLVNTLIISYTEDHVPPTIKGSLN